MDFHGIRCRGPFIVENRATLPTIGPEDKGRMVLNTTDGNLYVAGDTAWTLVSPIGGSGAPATAVAYDGTATGNPDADVQTTLDNILLGTYSIVYDNGVSGLSATTLKDAIDEVAAAAGDSANVGYDNSTSGLTASDVQAALDELAQGSGSSDNITYDNSTSGLTATDVQSALDEIAASSGDATSTVFTPNGSISSTNVQDAIVEVRDNMVAGELDTRYYTKTEVGSLPTGDVVGATDTQTLTNKTIDADNNTITNMDDGNIKAGANIDAAKIGTGVVTTTEYNHLNGVTSGIQGQLDAKIEAGSIDTLTNKTIDGDVNTIVDLTDSAIKAGANIDAAKIGTGIITTTVFNHLSGVSSNIQTQLDGKAASSHNHTVSDITDLTNPLQFRGAINVAADFPTSVDVATGWLFRVLSNVTDNDPTKTNTGQVFSANDEIAWNGTNWTILGSVGAAPITTFTGLTDTPSIYVGGDAGKLVAVNGGANGLEFISPVAAPVDSVFGRTGTVVAATSDYDASQIDNDSGVTGATVAAALNTLDAAIPTVPVASVHGRTGVVVSVNGDYNSGEITNASGVTGATVSAALDTLDAAIPPTAPVDSVHGRTGTVVAATSDYDASQVDNDSGVTGATVAAALDTLDAAIPTVPVASVFGRTGVVVAATSDYDASQVDNDSGVTGATVAAALDTLDAAIPTVPVSSVHGRTGAVVAVNGDYTASNITNVPAGAIAAVTVQAAIDELDSEKAPNAHAHLLAEITDAQTTPAPSKIPVSDATTGKIDGGWIGDVELSIPGTDQTQGSHAEIIKVGTGTLTLGKLYYLSTGGVWTETNPTGDDTIGSLIGIALGTSPTTNGLLLKGVWKDTTNFITGPSIGEPIYARKTATGTYGDKDTTSTGDRVRIIGYMVATDTVYFNPDKTWIEV